MARMSKNVKKAFGVGVWVIAASFALNIQFMKDLVVNYALISVGVLIVAGALLYFGKG